MSKSASLRILLALLTLALLLPVLATAKAKKKPKRVVKEKVQLEVGAPLRLQFDGDLTTCRDWNCFLYINEKAGKKLYMVELLGDGSWVAFEQEGKEGDEGETDDDDSAAADDDDSADSWMAKPLLTWQERLDKAKEKAMKGYTIEKHRGTLTVEGEASWLILPPDLLPADDFDLAVNGYWGAKFGDVVIGSGPKTGLVVVER